MYSSEQSDLCCLLPFPREERECTDPNALRIYVYSLAARSQGLDHGIWIDAAQDADKIEEDIQWMLSWASTNPESYAERDEWAVLLTEDWHGIKLHETEETWRISTLANLLKEYGKAFALYYQNYRQDFDLEDFKKRYLGKFESQEDFVYQTWKKRGILAGLEKLGVGEYCINWEAVARAYFSNGLGSFVISYKETYVFDLSNTDDWFSQVTK